MEEKHGNIYLISGLIIGLLFGLIYSWLLDPVEFIDAAPNSLSEEYKDQYRELIAMAYTANDDMGRAQARLTLLEENDQVLLLGAQGQRLQGDSTKIRQARAVLQLAEELQSYILNGPTPFVVQDATQQPQENAVEPTITAEVTDSNTVSNPSSEPKNEGLFQLDQQMDVCDPNLPQGLLQVVVVDSAGEPIPGVRGTVYWEEGNDYFYTGLYPDLGDGYGDYVMKATVTYKLQIGMGSTLIEEITPPICTLDNGKEYFGSLWMQFSRLE
ncbi:MAG: hypothetical protein JEZ00_09925 [Anaerolineaceae bacterium]|nr:hypothetical protein [Anaerolineaceae bacterium]